MKIKLSKSQWEDMGKTAGWIKTASPENVQKVNEVIDYLKKIISLLDSIVGPYRFVAEKGALISIYKKINEYLKLEERPANIPSKITAGKKQSDEEMIDTYLAFRDNGRANQNGITEKDVDQNELKMGIEIEYEHTTDRETAKRIALDHLAEIKDYYTRLVKMEKEGKKSKNE